MRVFTLQAVSELVGLGLAERIRAGVQKPLHDGCGARCGLMRAQPVGTAESGLVPCDVVDILDAEGEACERPAPRAAHRGMRVAAEGVERIAFEYVRHQALRARRARSFSWIPPKLPLLMSRT